MVWDQRRLCDYVIKHSNFFSNRDRTVAEFFRTRFGRTMCKQCDVVQNPPLAWPHLRWGLARPRGRQEEEFTVILWMGMQSNGNGMSKEDQSRIAFSKRRTSLKFVLTGFLAAFIAVDQRRVLHYVTLFTHPSRTIEPRIRKNTATVLSRLEKKCECLIT